MRPPWHRSAHCRVTTTASRTWWVTCGTSPPCICSTATFRRAVGRASRPTSAGSPTSSCSAWRPPIWWALCLLSWGSSRGCPSFACLVTNFQVCPAPTLSTPPFLLHIRIARRSLHTHGLRRGLPAGFSRICRLRSARTLPCAYPKQFAQATHHAPPHSIDWPPRLGCAYHLNAHSHTSPAWASPSVHRHRTAAGRAGDAGEFHAPAGLVGERADGHHPCALPGEPAAGGASPQRQPPVRSDPVTAVLHATGTPLTL